MKSFEKSLSNFVFPITIFKSTSSPTRSAFFPFGSLFVLLVLYALSINSTDLKAQDASSASSSIYPYFVSGPAAENALPLQIIDIHFKDLASLNRSYVYLRDAEISGANDLVYGAADTWVTYSILSPTETDLMANIPANIDQIQKWGTAQTQVNFKMAGNITADGKSILLKKLTPQDALKQADGSYKIRVLAHAMEGNDINRFGLFITEQPTKNLISPNAIISAPFLNILDNSGLGNTTWQVKNNSDKAARVSVFLSKPDGNTQNLSSFITTKNSPNASWEKLDFASATNRLIGTVLVDKGQTHYFLSKPTSSSEGGVRLYIAQNAKLLDLLEFSMLLRDIDMEEPEIAKNRQSTKAIEQEEIAPKNEQRPNDKAASFSLSIKAIANNCSTYAVTLEAENPNDMAKLRQISWSNAGLINSTKTTATYQIAAESATLAITADVQYLENNTLKKMALPQSLKQNIAPKADGGINRSAEINEYITFDGTLSEDVDGQIKAYFWDFGDGTTKNGARIEHKYQQTGVYQVVLTVVDNTGGDCGVSTDTLEVSINKEPVIVLSPDQPSTVGMNQYNVGQSYDEDGQITDISWYLNDKIVGKSPFIEINLKASDSPLKVVITDNSFARNRSSERIIYQQSAGKPTAVAGKDLLIKPGETAVLQADAKAADAAFPVVEYEWQFGQEVFSTKRVSKSFAKAGTFQALLKVKDGRGMTAEDELTIFVNSQPTARFSFTEIAGNEVKLSAATSFDADAQELSYSWTLGNEKKATGMEVNYTFQKAGSHSISLSVNDGSNAPNSTDTYSQTISLGSISEDNAVPAKTTSSEDSATETKSILDEILNPKEPQRPKILVSNLPFEQAKIDGPATVFVGQKATFELKTEKQPTAIFWDSGEGISGNGNELSIEFNEAGIRQITAIFFEKKEGKTNEQYLTTEVEIIDRSKEDSKLEAIVAHNRSIISGRYVQLMLNAGENAKEVFKRKDETFRKTLYQIANEPSVDGSKSWKRFSGYCENQLYNLNTFFGLPDELLSQDRLYVFVNGKLVTASTYANQAINLSVITAYEIRVYYPESVLPEAKELQFKHLLKADLLPEIKASVASRVQVNEWKTYSAANSYDPDGQVLRYYWEMGDGLRYAGKTVRHQYVHPGVYEVKLMVESGKGLSDCEQLVKKWSVEVY